MPTRYYEPFYGTENKTEFPTLDLPLADSVGLLVDGPPGPSNSEWWKFAVVTVIGGVDQNEDPGDQWSAAYQLQEEDQQHGDAWLSLQFTTDASVVPGVQGFVQVQSGLYDADGNLHRVGPAGNSFSPPTSTFSWEALPGGTTRWTLNDRFNPGTPAGFPAGELPIFAIFFSAFKGEARAVNHGDPPEGIIGECGVNPETFQVYVLVPSPPCPPIEAPWPYKDGNLSVGGPKIGVVR